MGRGMVGSMGEWERSSFDPRFTPSRKWISYFPVGKLIAGTNTSGVGSWRKLGPEMSQIRHFFLNDVFATFRALIFLQEPTPEVLVPAIKMDLVFCCGDCMD